MKMPQSLYTLSLLLLFSQSFCAYLTAKQLTTSEGYELLSLYSEYYNKVTDQRIKKLVERDWNALIAQYIILELLDVDYSLEEIKQNYAKYGVFILRDPTKSKKLLIDTGNSPLLPVSTGSHQHKGYITISPVLSMNPTIVGAYGFDRGISSFLKDKKHSFDSAANVNTTTYR